MLHMFREYALANQVSIIRLGQGLRENAETVDFWMDIGFSVDAVKSSKTARLILDENLDIAFFGLNLPEGRSFMRARLELGACFSWNAALQE